MNHGAPVYADHRELLTDLCALGDAMLEAALSLQRRDHACAAGPDATAAPVSAATAAWRPTVLMPQRVAPQPDELSALVDARWSAVAERMSATREAGVFIPWIHLAQLFQLTREEQQLLLAALLGELDDRYHAVLRALDDVAPTHGSSPGSVSLRAAAWLLGGGAPGRLAVQQALGSDAAPRHWQLVEFGHDTQLAALAGSFQLTPAVAAYLLAAGAPQLRLGEALTPLRSDIDLADHLVSPAVLDRLGHFIDRCGPDEPGNLSHILHLQGPDTRVLNSLCAATFARWGLGCVQLDGRQIWRSHVAAHRNREELVPRLRLLCRDALLCNRVLVISHPQWLSAPDAADTTSAAGSADDLFETVFDTLLESQRYCAVLNGPSARLADFAHGYDAHPALPVQVRVPPPDAGLRRRIWQRLSAAQGLTLEPALVDRLVGNYLFTEEQIRLALKDAAARALMGETATGPSLGIAAAAGSPAPDPLAALLFDVCREQNNADRLAIAKEVKTGYQLGDIVLAPATRGWLVEILQYALHRHQVLEQWGFDTRNQNGKNLCMLFHGPSGTGKTMAASIIANELGLGLFKVDLASVLSKYIGETEKHLAQLFDQAEAMNVVLFFDEAESLFSKRTETRDAHDRYANLQTGYLLQRIETYPGIVILSTNLMKNMDKAFTRRFKFMLEFAFPGVEERRRLWRNAFPAALPQSGDIDFELLAERVAVSGGHINNIAMRAAVYAAADGQALAMRHILNATEREYDKLGKVFAAADFAWGDDE